MKEENKTSSIMERHAQTVIMGVVAGLIGWVGVSVTSQGRELAIMSEQIKFMNEQMADLKAFSKQPRFTKDDFFTYIAPYAQKVEVNTDKLNKREEWMNNIEKRLNSLERGR